MRWVNCKQQSYEWHTVRMGRITASRLGDVMAKLKTKPNEEAAARRNYRIELMAERLTGQTENHYVSEEMLRGTEEEPLARGAYERFIGEFVDPLGFCFHPTLDYSGSSPDALCGHDGGVELKNPKTATHLSYLLNKTIPQDYIDQCQWNMACTERSWWDFCSYDSRIPNPSLKLYVVRLDRDDQRIAEIATEVTRLHDQIEEDLAKYGAVGLLPPVEPFIAQKVLVGS